MAMQFALHALVPLVVLAQSTLYNPDRPSLALFGFDGFDPSIKRLIGKGDAAEKIIERFGPPQRVELTREPDTREPGLIHDIKAWYYDGLQIVTAGSIEHGRHWIRKIVLTSPRYQLKLGLSIGSTKQRFIDKLGPPHPVFTKHPAVFVYPSSYYASEGSVAVASHSDVEIYFDQQGRANKIVWEYYAD